MLCSKAHPPARWGREVGGEPESFIHGGAWGESHPLTAPPPHSLRLPTPRGGTSTMCCFQCVLLRNKGVIRGEGTESHGQRAPQTPPWG